MKNNKAIIVRLLASLSLGLGMIFLISPIFLYWFIRGDYDRYLWIINGPFPFDNFGSGPFQIAMYLGLFIGGLSLILIGITLERYTEQVRLLLKRLRI